MSEHWLLKTISNRCVNLKYINSFDLQTSVSYYPENNCMILRKKRKKKTLCENVSVSYRNIPFTSAPFVLHRLSVEVCAM